MQSFPGWKESSVTSKKCFSKKYFVPPWVSKEYLGKIASKAVDEVTLFRLLILHIL